MDDLQYETQNFQNRNRVKVNNGAAWLTVPLKHGSRADLINQKSIDNSGSSRQHWQARTWSTLKTHYGRAPHFAQYADDVADVYARTWERLIDLDLHILDLARRWIGSSSQVVRASSLRLEGKKTERIIDLCRKLGADIYVSGGGGSTDYLDVAALERAGILVVWQQFNHPIYPQRYPELGFVPNLAFLDL
jgi:hypothetical protein